MTKRFASITVLSALCVLLPTSAALAAGGTTTGADLQVSGSASTGSPAPGATYTYTFQIKNAGPDAATSAVFSNPLPAGTVYNYATDNGSTLPCAAFGNLNGGALGAALQADGKIVAVGFQATFTDTRVDFALARYLGE